MEMPPLKPERKAQLDNYARRHGQLDTASALDEVLANYLEWEEQDYRESVEGIRKGYEEKTKPISKDSQQTIQSVREGGPRKWRSATSTERRGRSLEEGVWGRRTPGTFVRR